MYGSYFMDSQMRELILLILELYFKLNSDIFYFETLYMQSTPRINYKQMIMKDCRYLNFFPGILENEEKKFNVDTNAY